MNKNRDERPVSGGAGEVGTADEDGFLSRWSQRKALAREGVESPPDNVPVSDPVDDAPATELDEEASAAADDAPPELPPLESLGEDSDYSAFLNSKVSKDVQRQALRKLFHSPKFNVRDGLDDYDLDFSNPEPLGNVITAEMRHRIRVELERLVENKAESDTPEEAPVLAVDADGAGDPEPPVDAESNDERIEPT